MTKDDLAKSSVLNYISGVLYRLYGCVQVLRGPGDGALAGPHHAPHHPGHTHHPAHSVQGVGRAGVGHLALGIQSINQPINLSVGQPIILRINQP